MEETPPTAWQPLTPRGVAAFARAPLRRLLLVQFAVALFVAGAVGWFIHDSYFPVLSKAIEQLPAKGQIRDRTLDWRGRAPVLLAENRFLALSVDLDRSGTVRSVAHLQFEVGRTSLIGSSLLGYTEIEYPAGWIIAVNRDEMQPLWGAWQPAVLVGAVGAVMLVLLLNWFLLALLYTGPVWALGLLLNRDLDRRGSFRLAGAALLPGALLMLLVISFYGLGVMDLVQVAFGFGVHVVLGWVFLLTSPFFLPRAVARGKAPENPFAAAKSE